MAIAITFTVTATPTGLLSTKAICSEPSLSLTCLINPDPPSDSKETVAIVIIIKAVVLSVA